MLGELTRTMKRLGTGWKMMQMITGEPRARSRLRMIGALATSPPKTRIGVSGMRPELIELMIRSQTGNTRGVLIKC